MNSTATSVFVMKVEKLQIKTIVHQMNLCGLVMAIVMIVQTLKVNFKYSEKFTKI